MSLPLIGYKSLLLHSFFSLDFKVKNREYQLVIALTRLFYNRPYSYNYIDHTLYTYVVYNFISKYNVFFHLFRAETDISRNDFRISISFIINSLLTNIIEEEYTFMSSFMSSSNLVTFYHPNL